MENSALKRRVESLEAQLIDSKSEIILLKAEITSLKHPERQFSRDTTYFAPSSEVSPVLTKKKEIFGPVSRRYTLSTLPQHLSFLLNPKYSATPPKTWDRNRFPANADIPWDRPSLKSEKKAGQSLLALRSIKACIRKEDSGANGGTTRYVAISEDDWRSINSSVDWIRCSIFDETSALDGQDKELVSAVCRYLEESHPSLQLCNGGWISRAILQNKLGNKAKKTPKLQRLNDTTPTPSDDNRKGKKRMRDQDRDAEEMGTVGKRRRMVGHADNTVSGSNSIFDLSNIEFLQDLFEENNPHRDLLQALHSALSITGNFPPPQIFDHNITPTIERLIEVVRADVAAWRLQTTGRSSELSEEDEDNILTGFGHKLDPANINKLCDWKEIRCADSIVEIFELIVSGMKIESGSRDCNYLFVTEKLHKLVEAIVVGWVEGRGKGLFEWVGDTSWKKCNLPPPSVPIIIEETVPSTRRFVMDTTSREQTPPPAQELTDLTRQTPPLHTRPQRGQLTPSSPAPSPDSVKASDTANRNIIHPPYPRRALVPTRTTFHTDLTTVNPSDGAVLRRGRGHKEAGVGKGKEKEKEKKRTAGETEEVQVDVLWRWKDEKGEDLESKNKAWGASEKELTNRYRYTISDCRTVLMDFGLPTNGKKAELVQRILRHQAEVQRSE
ncbi:hypothetical protein BT69DRAFT_1352434 [Atractiella rhizophila]|nr:hypothetical protein BT69DRAFT_1352434 [Atractiella rhizophila]